MNLYWISNHVYKKALKYDAANMESIIRAI